jgi:hypothetical protein
MQASLIDKKVQTQQLQELFDEWWAIWPVGQKLSKEDASKAWFKVFLKHPGIAPHDWDDFARNVVMQALKDQVNYRKSVFKKYPTPEERKRNDIFVPRMVQPPRWLNGHKWEDTVQQLPREEVSSNAVKQSCMDCPGEATILVEGNPLCAWHWTKRFDRPHLKRLAESLDKMGLARLANESREAWSDRCREYIRGGKWAAIVKA